MAKDVVVALSVLTVVACGTSSNKSAPDAAIVADGALAPDASVDAALPYPAQFPAPPNVVNSGGPLLAHPKIVPVFFSNDDASAAATLGDFTQQIGATAYWAALAEYGIGAATSPSTIALDEAAPTTIDDAAIQTWLAGKLNANDAAWPAADANTVYVLYYPAGTTITLSGASSCVGFGGYHNSVQLDASHANMNVAYAVVPRCASFGALASLDAWTGIASHELVEAATDPYPNVSPGYAQVDDADVAWMFVLGGAETGDMCAQQASSFTKFAELPAYTVQRFWSNASAAAGHDPCVPSLPGEVYFQSAPVLPDMVSLTGLPVPLKGVQIPVGQSKVISVDLFSDAPTSGPWTVQALDYAQLRGGSPNLSFSFDRTSGTNGDVLKLTITVLRASQFGAEPFVVVSTLGSATPLWVGVVGS